MVKPRRKFSFSDNCPQFFKVFLPQRSSQRLQIPRVFLQHFHGGLPSESKIRTRGRRLWRVEVREVDNNVYFQKGWNVFVQDNSIETGDFLVFCYGGDLIFSVKVYGRNGCLKEACISARKSKKPFGFVQENQKIEPRKYEELVIEDNVKEKKRSRTLRPAVQENDKPPAKSLSSKPSFKVVMTKAYVKNGCLYIPSSFTTPYMKKGKQKAILRVSAQSWDAKLLWQTNNIYRLGKGWATFVKDNTLQVGDACLFELIDRDDFALEVSVFRSLH